VPGVIIFKMNRDYLVRRRAKDVNSVKKRIRSRTVNARTCDTCSCCGCGLSAGPLTANSLRMMDVNVRPVIQRVIN
jgi:hypothetical protein